MDGARVRCKRGLDGGRGYNSSRNSSTVNPASRTIPPIVYALIGLCRGMVRMRTPSVMTVCLPCLTTLKPAFFKARMASL